MNRSFLLRVLSQGSLSVSHSPSWNEERKMRVLTNSTGVSLGLGKHSILLVKPVPFAQVRKISTCSFWKFELLSIVWFTERRF